MMVWLPATFDKLTCMHRSLLPAPFLSSSLFYLVQCLSLDGSHPLTMYQYCALCYELSSPFLLLAPEAKKSNHLMQESVIINRNPPTGNLSCTNRINRFTLSTGSLSLSHAFVTMHTFDSSLYLRLVLKRISINNCSSQVVDAVAASAVRRLFSIILLNVASSARSSPWSIPCNAIQSSLEIAC